jgi:ABC-type Mn2+/Zn2+ transport system permease subunit
MRNSRIGFRVVVVMATLVVVWLTSAQTFRGRITGIVTDESKAVVAGANVRLTNVGFACLAMLGSAHEEKL